jgi:hypothetical protein
VFFRIVGFAFFFGWAGREDFDMTAVFFSAMRLVVKGY